MYVGESRALRPEHVRKTSVSPVGQRYIVLLGEYMSDRNPGLCVYVCVCVCVRCGPGKRCWSDAGWVAGGPVFSRGGRGRGQERESHGSQPPAASVDQLQGCSLSGAVRRWEEERKRGKGRNTDK